MTEELINPDQPRDQSYPWDIRYQQEILSMLLADRVFLIQSMELIHPRYFISFAHEVICSAVFDYFRKYRQMPGRFVIANLIRERKQNDKKLTYYLSELDVLSDCYIPGLESREAVLVKITEFAKEQALRSAVSYTLDILKKNSENKWDRIRELFRGALAVDRHFDVGLDYFNTVDARFDRMAEALDKQEAFVTGFEGIDGKLSAGGLCRGEIASYLGLPGVSKTNLLIKSAVQNLARAKKVLFLTLEMDQDKIAKRFDAQLSLVPINRLFSKDDIADTRTRVINALADHVREEEDKRRLIIKQFPGGMANVDTFRAYTSQMVLNGFKPDMLCVDYVGEMKDVDDLKTYESRQRLVRDLRAFGVEESHCTFTAMQPSRRAREQQEIGHIDDDSLADSFGQARPLDALWSINQTASEKQAGIARIFVVKHRDGESRHTFFVRQNPQTLDITQIDQSTYGDLKSKAEAMAGKSVGEKIGNMVGKKFKPNGDNE